MDVLGEAITRDRRSDATALRVPAVGRSYDYRRFCTSAWKVGNFLRHHGVRGGDVVVVADYPLPEAVLSLYGAGSLGGVVRFGSPRSTDGTVSAIVAPASEVDRYDVAPATKRIAYGDRPADPSVAYFERDVWSENPTEPPDRVESAAPLLAADHGSYTHDDVLAAATAVVEDLGLSPGSTVAVDAPFDHPGAVVAGLVAPVVVGAAASIGPGSEGDVTVGADGAIDPEAVMADLETV